MATCYYFKLIPETGIPVYIDEPIKWADVQIIGKRDSDWHGFNYEYTDGDVLLEFDCAAGKDFIQSVYDSEGFDGLILLQFGRIVGLTEIVEYEGKLNLATFKRVKSRIACSVEKNGLHDLVKSRWSTKVNLFANKTLDGGAITPIQPLDLELHSKTLINNFSKKTGVEGTQSGTPLFVKNLHDVYYTFNTQGDGADNSNIDHTEGTSLGVSELDPTQISRYVFDLNAGGLFTFNINLDYRYNIKLIKKSVSLKPKIGDWSLNHYLHVIDKNGNLRVKKAFSGYSGNRDGQFLTTPGSVQAKASLINFQIELESGDKVYIYAHFNLDGTNAGWKGVESYIQTFGTRFDVTAETATIPTQTKAFLVHEALDTTLKIATGDENSLHSDFLGRVDLGYPVDGCGSANMVTNGFQIRAFDIANKAPQISLKELLSSLNALYCIGMGYEADKLRVEHRQYFYQDAEILFIPEVSDYEDYAASELAYNNIEIGYSKFPEDGLRLLDEYNTKHEYLSPVRRHDNQFSQLSPLIGSGYAIEITRRSQFSDTAIDSTKYDDDNFLISVISQETPIMLLSFKRIIGANLIITTSIPFTLKAGQRIKIEGTILNNRIFTVKKTNGNNIYVNETVTTETHSGKISNVSAPFRTEKDEAFSTVTGVVSPETSYNLRHSPKRMLMRWAKWLNGGFYYKSSGDVIQNTFYAKNGELTTQFNDAETCSLGDPQKDLITEKEDIALAEFDEFNKYFIPKWVTFKARMTRDEINTIRDAMTGQSVDASYGFIRSIMPNGDHLESWIYEMSYNPNTEQVSFKCLKKRVIPIDNPDPLLCTDYSSLTVGEAEALSQSEQSFIENCRFDNFDL